MSLLVTLEAAKSTLEVSAFLRDLHPNESSASAYDWETDGKKTIQGADMPSLIKISINTARMMFGTPTSSLTSWALRVDERVAMAGGVYPKSAK